VRRHKLCEVDSEYTLHNCIVLATCMCALKIVIFGADLTKKQVGSFFGLPCK